MTELSAVFADIEADLITASLQGSAALHSEIFKKFASLVEDEKDIAAILTAIDSAATLPVKSAGFGFAQQTQPLISPGIAQTLSLGLALAGPVMAVANYVANSGAKDRALLALQQQAPALFQANPQRAKAVFEAIYSTAPNLASNPLVAADLMKQLMSMPSLDLGTIARLAEIAKNTSQRPSGGGVGDIMSTSQTALKAVADQSQLKRAHVACTYVDAFGSPTFFNWRTDAVKQAGLTDAFVGSGTTLDQANNATNMQQMQQGSTMLPLDAIVHELLMKEMELAQREQVIAQNEQQLQQALQTVQQMGSAYQDQTGVDPNTGNVAQQPQAEEAQPAEQQQAYAEEAQPAEQQQAYAEEAQQPPADVPQDQSYTQLQPDHEEADPSQQIPAHAAYDDGGDVETMPVDNAPAYLDGNPNETQVDTDGYGDQGTEVPVGGDGEGEEAPVPGDDPSEEAEGANEDKPGDEPVEGEEDEDDKHDLDIAAAGEAVGPNTAESVEQTPEDETHDAINNVEEGSPEDEIADQELAAVLNAGGHVAGTPAVINPPANAVPVAPVPAPTEHEIVVPLRISVKIGNDRTHDDAVDVRALINSLKGLV